MAEKVQKKSGQTKTQSTHKSNGSADITFKIKKTEPKIESKTKLEEQYDKENPDSKKANLAFINSHEDLAVEVEDFIWAQVVKNEIFEAISRSFKWDNAHKKEAEKVKDALIEQVIYDEEGYLANIKYAYYTKYQGEYEVDEVLMENVIKAKIKDPFDTTKSNKAEEYLLDLNQGTYEDKEFDELDHNLNNANYRGITDDIISKKQIEKARQRKSQLEKEGFEIDDVLYRKTVVKSGPHKGRIKHRIAYLSPEYYKETYEGRLLEAAEKFGVSPEEVVLPKYTPTGGAHRKITTKKALAEEKENQRKLREEARTQRNEVYASIKNEFYSTGRTAESIAREMLVTEALNLGIKLHNIKMPKIDLKHAPKTPNIQITEWAGKEIYTPLLNPFPEEAKVTITDKNGKARRVSKRKKFVAPKIELIPESLPKPNEFKVSKNYAKAGVFLEFYPCFVAATYFQILCSLTPIDEEYDYDVVEGFTNVRNVAQEINQLRKGLLKRNMYRKYRDLKTTYGNESNDYEGLRKQIKIEFRRRTIHHKPDKDIVRADWILHFRGHEFKAFKSNRSGKWVEFEEDWFYSTGDMNSVMKIAQVIYETVKNDDDLSNNFYCTNLNELRKNMLEYGRYSTTTTNENGKLTRRIGSKYGFEHGVMNNGFVYQAPAGFERITKAYYEKCLKANRGYATKFIKTCTTDKYHGYRTKKEFTDLNSKMLKKLQKLDPSIGAEGLKQ